MVTEDVTVQVPARSEVEREGGVWGRSGDRVLRRRFGAAAMRVGDPDFDLYGFLEPRGSVQTTLDHLADLAAETIANILHVFPRGGVDHQAVLDLALERYKSYPPPPEPVDLSETHELRETISWAEPDPPA